MTRAAWDLLSTLLYGRPGQELPAYVARRATELDVYIRDMHLPANSPIVLAHAEQILAIYRMDTRSAEQWAAIQQAIHGMVARLDRIERRLAPPAPSTPSGPARPQAQASPRPARSASEPVVVQPSDSLPRRFWRAVKGAIKDWFCA